jgi:hypothetical protein
MSRGRDGGPGKDKPMGEGGQHRFRLGGPMKEAAEVKGPAPKPAAREKKIRVGRDGRLSLPRDIAAKLGAEVVMVSHVLPYEADMEKEMLCRLTLSLDTFASVPQKTVIHLPRFDINALTRDTVFKLLQGYERRISPYFPGDIRRTSLSGIWNSQEYGAFREKVKAFEFSSCHLCGRCHLLGENAEDCFGNAFPACGGCLWAQGVIQCP